MSTKIFFFFASKIYILCFNNFFCRGFLSLHFQWFTLKSFFFFFLSLPFHSSYYSYKIICKVSIVYATSNIIFHFHNQTSNKTYVMGAMHTSNNVKLLVYNVIKICAHDKILFRTFSYQYTATFQEEKCCEKPVPKQSNKQTVQNTIYSKRFGVKRHHHQLTRPSENLTKHQVETAFDQSPTDPINLEAESPSQ